MVVLVLSCDKNEDLWQPFHYCMEKYFPNHPKVIYKTETLTNPYYETIQKNYPLNMWTKGIRECLDEIDDEHILLMMDDIFIRKEVDIVRISNLLDLLKIKHTANINFEKSFDRKDKYVLNGIKKRSPGGKYSVSLMCGLWNKSALKKILSEDVSPWEAEERNKTYGYDFYINDGDFIIDWGYTYSNYAGVQKGKWCLEAKEFFDKEGVDIDYGKRGFVNNNTPL